MSAVNARELWEKLGSKQKFSDWIKARIEKYEFAEGADYIVHKIMTQYNQIDSVDYFISLDMAKELSMVENNAPGKAARRYFIECERALKQPSNDGAIERDPVLEIKKVTELVRETNELASAIGIDGVDVRGFIVSVVKAKSGFDLKATTRKDGKLVTIGVWDKLDGVVESELPIFYDLKDLADVKFVPKPISVKDVVNVTLAPEPEVEIDESANGISVFNFEQNKIRTVVDDNGDVWFVAKDVAESLGYVNCNDAIYRHCKNQGIVKHDSVNLSGKKYQIVLINEPNVYRLIMKSKLPAAERFEEWVVGEVLPTIRKTGKYEAPKPEQSKMRTIKDDFEVGIEMAKMIGLDGNRAILKGNNIVRNTTGVDVLKAMDVKLIAEVQDNWLSPTKLGRVQKKRIINVRENQQA